MRPVTVVTVIALAVVAVLAVAFVVRSRKTAETDFARLPRPWGDRPSIYSHVKAHLSPTGSGLAEGGERLPDEDGFIGEGGLRWAPGALDGVLGHHAAEKEGEVSATAMADGIRALIAAPSGPGLKHAYALLADASALGHVDALLDTIVARKELDAEGLQSFARWLVTHAPDRGAVKMGLALLGLFQGDSDRELFLTLGRHDEFTLYSAVALRNSLREPDPALFELARSVDGWGRIQVVERLRDTTDPGVKRWLLREGYKNSIMYEYLAHLCATAGGLRAELEAAEVDDALLAGAADLLGTLINGQGGPAEGIDDYADGAAAARLYLRHLEKRLAGAPLVHLTALSALTGFVDEAKADWSARAGRGWTPEVRSEIRAKGGALIANPRWRERVEAGLASPDAAGFFEAGAAAKVLGIDTWEHQLDRVSANGAGGSWFELSQTESRERMARVVSLAERLLPLERIATGPGTEMGFGKEWKPHGDLDFVLVGLSRFPGLGWTLVRTGLRSPVTRNRNMALRALAEWGQARWPADARATLTEARAREPDEKVRARIDRVLNGKPLGD